MQVVGAESAGHAGHLLTAEQVGQALGVDTSTVYRMAADGRLTAVKVGRQWRFPSRLVDDLLDQRPAQEMATPDRAPSAIDPAAAAAAVRVAADLLGVMMVVTDMAGRPLIGVANPCPAFVESADDADTIERCAAEWSALAQDLDFEPRFRLGTLGFECARAFVRRGDRLVGMVLAGGVAPDGTPQDAGLYALAPEHRRRVLAALPRVAAALSTTNP